MVASKGKPRTYADECKNCWGGKERMQGREFSELQNGAKKKNPKPTI